MYPELRNWVREHIPEDPGPVLEIGCRDINGSVREFFDPPDYTGLDIHPDKNVDIVWDIEKVNYRLQDRFGLVVCLETLEHLSRFWLALKHIRTYLTDDGIMLCSTPTFGFQEHETSTYRDYYRFTVSAFEDVIFDGYEILALGAVHDTIDQPGLVGMGRKD